MRRESSYRRVLHKTRLRPGNCRWRRRCRYCYIPARPSPIIAVAANAAAQDFIVWIFTFLLLLSDGSDRMIVFHGTQFDRPVPARLSLVCMKVFDPVYPLAHPGIGSIPGLRHPDDLPTGWISIQSSPGHRQKVAAAGFP